MSEGIGCPESSADADGCLDRQGSPSELAPDRASLQLQVLDQLSEAVFLIDSSGRIVTWNRAAASLYGYEAGEIEGRSLSFLYGDEQLARNLLRRVLAGDRVELEAQVRTKAKEVRWMRMVSTPLTDRSGRALGVIVSSRDIGERRRVEDALRESERHYRELVDSLPETVYETDLTGRLTYSNPAGFIRFRASQEDFDRGLNVFDLIAPEDCARARENFAAVLKGELVEPQEYVALRPDGTSFPCLIYSTPRTVSGRVAGLRGFLVDITESKHAAQKLAESEERYRTLFDQASDAIFVEDENDQILNANRRACELYGYTLKELLRMSVGDLQPPEIRRPHNVVRATLDQHAGEVYESLALHSSGRRIPVEVGVARLGNAGSVIVVVRDITERKRAQIALARRADVMAALYRTSLEINSQPDMPALLRSIVERAATLVGTAMGGLYLMQPDGETLELAVGHLMPADLIGTRLKLGEGLSGRVAKTGEPLIVEDYRRWADRADVYAGHPFGRVLGVPLRINDRIIGVINVTDVGPPGTFSEEEVRLVSLFADQAAIAIENARLSSSLQEINDQLRSALQAKDEMIQNVSHELRTPLTHILGYVELLSGAELGPLTDEQMRALEVMEQQAGRLRHMVNRVLALQSAEAKVLRKSSLDVASWLASSIEPWQSRAVEIGVSLILDLEPGLPPLLADPDYLGQVTENLLDNAMKFSTAGGEVRVRVWSEDGQFLFVVSDQGMGIPSDKLERVFERFYQVDGGSNRRFGGMGIGLPLCRKIVEAHGGRIWAESCGEGQGTRLCFVLPMPAC